jgi:hypothetical protein
MTQPFAEILHRMRRSARNGERLHLDAAHVVAIMTSPIYAEMARLEAEELASQWQSNTDLVSFGLLGAQTATNGQSVGMTVQLEPAAESQLLSAISTEAKRQSRHRKNSPHTSQNSGRQKRLTSTQSQVLAG